MGDTLINNDESPENLEAVANNVLKPWLQDAWDAIRSDTGYNSKGKYYTEYIDIESFAKMYLMHEFVKSYDVCAGSILYHRDGQTDADKLIAGPLWDLDNALGATFQNSSLGRADDRRNGDRRSAEGDFIPNITEYKTSVYKTISKHEDFMAEVYRQYNLHRDQFDSIANDTQQMIDSIEASARMNHIKVDDLRNNNHKYSSAASFGSGQYKQNYLATTNSKTDWGNYVANLKTFITIRSLWFHNHYYDPDFVDPSTCEHQYETVTVPATCTSTGSVTYTCPICKDSYVEELPIIAHDYQDGVCSVCGQILLTADIICGSGATVTVYETQDTSGASEENASSTHPRNSSTGLIDCSGDGQINFVINVKDGYELVDVTIEPRSSYKNLKGPDDTGIENGYRLTKVSGNLTITVQTHKISVTAPKISAHRLLLSSEIGVQFKLELPKDFDAAGSYMDFAVSDGRNFTMPVSEAEKVPGENTYWFTCYMNALELADTINATYHYGTDGVRSDRFSAMDYIESSRQIYPEMTNLLALMDALQDYGHYLQLSGWTDNHTHVPIAAVSTLDQDSIAEAKAVVSQMGVEKNLANSGITDAMFSLTLNSKTTINVFVRPGENVSITGSNAAANGTKEINGATYYQFSTEPIGALHLDQVYTVTVTTTAGTAVIQGSAMSYVDAVLGNSSFNMDQQLAMAAFYRYYAAAKAY